MKCHYCGFENDRREVFCPCCGTRQEEKRATQTVIPEKEYVPQPVPAVEIADLYEEFPDIRPTLSFKSEKPASPRLKLPKGRGLAKMVFLGILTLGIYPLVIWSRIVTELNIAASRYDGERTMPYFAMVVLTPFTLGIYMLVWFHDFCRRVGNELQRRGLECRFGAKDFWLWNVLGSLILVGPFIFTHKLMKSMNLINGDFNAIG